MIVKFTDGVTGTAVYINPAYVMTLRPEPADPLNLTVVKLADGETLQVRGEHTAVADRLSTPPV
jgi:hypothetical protein